MGIRRPVRFAGWLFRWGTAAFVVMTLSMLAWTFLWPEPDVRALQPADAIVCMGGSMSADGTLAASTLTRVERCVQLFEAGLAPVIIFSGGIARPTGPSAGAQMGRFAMTLGVPQDGVIAEGLAQSTLQNALFSLPLIPNAERIIIVTEAFHLPRSWASFRWAQWELGHPAKSFTLVMSEDVRRNPLTGDVRWNMLVRESLAIWFNAVRAAAYSVAPHDPVDWLH
jgi:uncharacterized SAM-binding protein YcdF (DUF218 family)